MLKNRTLKSILEDPMIAEIAPDAISKWDLTKEEYYNWTLQEIADKMGWRGALLGIERLFKAAETGNYYYRLYSKEECESAPEKKDRNFLYFPSEDPAASERPFIMVVPGGGFSNVWNITEGWPIARRFNELGYHAFILTYQVSVEGAALKAMDDMAKAMEIIAEGKEEFQVDPARYITCGFSAGGYLVCLWNSEKGYRAFDLPKPQMCIPVYPVTSYRLLGTDRDEAFIIQSLGCTLKEASESCFEIPDHVEGFPPAAIYATEEDQLVDPKHSRILANALEEAGIPCNLEIGPTGGHGFADGTGMCMEGWIDRAIHWYEEREGR